MKAQAILILFGSLAFSAVAIAGVIPKDSPAENASGGAMATQMDGKHSNMFSGGMVIAEKNSPDSTKKDGSNFLIMPKDNEVDPFGHRNKILWESPSCERFRNLQLQENLFGVIEISLKNKSSVSVESYCSSMITSQDMFETDGQSVSSWQMQDSKHDDGMSNRQTDLGGLLANVSMR